MLCTPEQLRLVASENLTALADLDARGLFPAPSETAPQFAQRLERLSAHLDKLQTAVQNNGTWEQEGFSFPPGSHIASKYFAAPAETTRKRYQFSIDWVPGFFINPTGSWLFGGCAYCDWEKPSVLFIIRRSFQKKERWLFYHRDELLAHELCHIARMPLDSLSFEETFAYQTSPKWMRRTIGGIFYQQRDSLLFLFSALALLVGQCLRQFLFSALPLWPFWLPFPLVVLWLTLRYAGLRRTMARAQEKLAQVFGENAQAVLFRCTDAEIAEIADCGNAHEWVKQQSSLRWKVIRQRF